MDELRNLTIIIPALAAIIISFIWFIFNYPYNSTKAKFNPVEKEYSKIEATVRAILVTFGALMSISIILIIIFIYFFKMQNEDLNNTMIWQCGALWILLLVFLGILVIKSEKIFENNILKASKTKCLKIKHKLKKNLIVILLYGAVIMIYSFLFKGYIFGENICITWNGNEFFTKINVKKIKYEDNKNFYICVNDKKFELYKEQYDENASTNIKFNISGENLYFYTSKDFAFTKDDWISLKEDDKNLVKGKYTLYSYWEKIFETILIITLPVLAIIYVSGIYFGYSKICSLKKYKINYSNKIIIGEILFEYEIFYLIRNNNKLKYIAKKEINELIIISNKKNNGEIKMKNNYIEKYYEYANIKLDLKKQYDETCDIYAFIKHVKSKVNSLDSNGMININNNLYTKGELIIAFTNHLHVSREKRKLINYNFINSFLVVSVSLVSSSIISYVAKYCSIGLISLICILLIILLWIGLMFIDKYSTNILSDSSIEQNFYELVLDILSEN